MSNHKNEILMEKNELAIIMEKIEKIDTEGPFFVRESSTKESEFPEENSLEIEVPLTINGIFGLFTFKV